MLTAGRGTLHECFECHHTWRRSPAGTTNASMPAPCPQCGSFSIECYDGVYER